jgi:hypothetical protein
VDPGGEASNPHRALHRMLSSVTVDIPSCC